MSIVQAFIACRLKTGLVQLAVVWCDGEPAKKIQSVLNSAARLLTNTGRRDHIIPVSRQLHWLSVQRRVEFKIACLVHSSSWYQKCRRTSLPTFDSSVSMVVVLSAHLPTGHSLFHGHAAVLATEALLLQDHACGIVYLLICDILCANFIT